MGRTNKILKGPEKLMVQSNSFHITKLNKKLVDKMVSKYQDDLMSVKRYQQLILTQKQNLIS